MECEVSLVLELGARTHVAAAAHHIAQVEAAEGPAKKGVVFLSGEQHEHSSAREHLQMKFHHANHMGIGCIRKLVRSVMLAEE